MNISVHIHSTTKLELFWTGQCEMYNVIVKYNNIIVHNEITKTNNISKSMNFATGTYEITVNDTTIISVVPALGNLSTGGCCFLVQGTLFGLNRPVLMTANHCIPNANVAKSTTVYFDSFAIKLSPEIYWKSSDRYVNGGIDYSCIGISDTELKKLVKHNITAHELSTDSLNTNVGLLTFCTNTQYAHRTVCNVYKRKGASIHYKYQEDFPNTMAGASGSPLFGISHNKLTVQGLHVAKGKATNISAIVFHINNNSIQV